jgi:hypothetical protein
MTYAKTNRYDPPMEHRPLHAGLTLAQYNAAKFKAFEHALVNLSDVIRSTDDLRTSIILDDFINRLSTERRQLVQRNASWFDPSFALFSYSWDYTKRLWEPVYDDQGEQVSPLYIRTTDEHGKTTKQHVPTPQTDAAEAIKLALTAFMPDDLTLAEIGLSDEQQPSAPKPAIKRIPVTADDEPKTTPRRSRRPGTKTTQSTTKARNNKPTTKGKSS